MNLKTKEIINKETWENFLKECSEKTFLQSWNWGEFQKLEGNKIWRRGIYEGESLLAVALVVKVAARRGTLLSLPHGPVVKSQISNLKPQILKALVDEIKIIAKQEKALFLRLSPIWERNEENIKIFKNLGFHNSPIHLHPDLTWELDLTPSEEELLMAMRKTHRYLIRKAGKDPDIKIEISRNINDLELFNKIYEEIAKHHHFVPYSLEYLKNELTALDPDNQVAIFLGKYKGDLAAAAIAVFWQDLAVYHHAATASKYAKIPVAYLMQWEIIKEAKLRGCKKYNFWGIAPPDNPKHPWQGFTLFKQGFGGYKREYVKTQDMAFSNFYWPVYIFEKIRKMKRRL